MPHMDSYYHYNDYNDYNNYNELNNTTNTHTEITNGIMLFTFLFFDFILISKCICYIFFKGDNDYELNTNILSEYEEIDYLSYDDNDVCSICLEKYFDEEDLKKVVSLKCKHLFHKECIDTWIRINKNCPMCKCDL